MLRLEAILCSGCIDTVYLYQCSEARIAPGVKLNQNNNRNHVPRALKPKAAVGSQSRQTFGVACLDHDGGKQAGSICPQCCVRLLS